MSDILTRGNSIGRLLDMLLWMRDQPGWFTRADMCEALEIADLTARRWANAFEARDLLESGIEQRVDASGKQIRGFRVYRWVKENLK